MYPGSRGFFYFSKTVGILLAPTKPPIQWVDLLGPLKIKRPELDVDRFSLHSAESKKGSSYTFTHVTNILPSDATLRYSILCFADRASGNMHVMEPT
jgi:hypothetical protein